MDWSVSLHTMALTKKNWEWISSFQKESVIVDGKHSLISYVISGVAQGAILQASSDWGMQFNAKKYNILGISRSTILHKF